MVAPDKLQMEEKKAIDFRLNKAIDKKSVEEGTEDPGRRAEQRVETLLDEMLSFLAEMPVDVHHDYRTLRHSGLRGYLINRFLRERTRS